MKQKSKKIKILLIVGMLLLTTGCTQILKDNEKKSVVNPATGQSLTSNILCQPLDENTRKLYTDNGVNIEELPKCTDFKLNSGKYEGIWTTIFVKPLAWLLLAVGNLVIKYGLAVMLVCLLIRLIMYPFTKKTAMQSELIKQAQPELMKIEAKYANANSNDANVMMKKSQEMTMVYKKYKINPMSSCLFAFIQLPLFIAFLEAINRVPAIFEENFLWMQMGTTPWIGFSKGMPIAYIVLVLAIGATTYYSFKMTTADAGANPAAPGMKHMPLIMTAMIILTGLFMPSALGLYWITSNVFTIFQNILVKRSKKLNEKEQVYIKKQRRSN